MAALTQSEVLPVGPVCTPNGAHAAHATVASCSVCHVCGGVLQFDPAGAAVAAGQPLPTFDATAKTCSNVACHGMYSGTFAFSYPNSSGTYRNYSYLYDGGGGKTPSWYSSGTGCATCHGNPPTPSTNPGEYATVWHMSHANCSFATACQCQTCHPDAISDAGYKNARLNTAMNCGPNQNSSCAALHANGSMDVVPQFNLPPYQCYHCH